jgi:hypothetical protein
VPQNIIEEGKPQEGKPPFAAAQPSREATQATGKQRGGEAAEGEHVLTFQHGNVETSFKTSPKIVRGVILTDIIVKQHQ